MDKRPRFIAAWHEMCDYPHHVPAPLFRKSFTLEKLPEEATLSVCGLGFYELFINGKKITKGLIAPYISNPDDYVYFDEYDLLPYLHSGENVLGFMLGNGMQNCPDGTVWDFQLARFRGVPRLAFVLEAEDEILLQSDESVRTAASEITFDSLRSGIHCDARLKKDGWSTPGYDDSAWGKAFFCECPRGDDRICEAEPVRVQQELPPVSIEKAGFTSHCPHHLFNGVCPEYVPDENESGWLYDFGVNSAGIIRLKVNGRQGQKIILQFGEYLKDGKLDVRNIDFYPIGYSQRDIYICRGDGEEIFEPPFTYHGFRYCLVMGIDDEQATPELLTYLVANSDLKSIGSFTCSDEMSNKLYECAERSDLANFYYFPTDCPHREKNGWTGDASVSSEHILQTLDAKKSYTEWLRNIRKAQLEDGSLPGIVPTGGWGYAWGNGPAWDSVLTCIPYNVYKYTGDRQILEENADSIFRYVCYLERHRNANGLVTLGLGDWCPVGRGAGDYKVPLEFTDSAVSMDICRKAAHIFAVLGLEQHREFALKTAEKICAAIRKELINFSRMTVLGDSQSGQALAIYLNIFEEAEKPEALRRLLEIIDSFDGHMDFGFLGGRVLFHVLAEAGYAELAFKMITRTDYPSYGNIIARGATSLWEDFQPEPLDRPNSLNHHFWGDIKNFYISKIAGIRFNPTADDTSACSIAPNFVPQLSFAAADYDSPLGKISVRWEREGDKLRLTVAAPNRIHGKILLPTGYAFDDKSILTYKNLRSGEFLVKHI